MSETTAYIRTANYSTRSERTIRGLVDYVATGFQQRLSTSGWQFLNKSAQSCILSTLTNLNKGQLHVEWEDEFWDFGKAYTLTKIDGPPRKLSASIKVLKESFWTRLFFHPDFGFADAFMLNEVEVDSLNDLFRIFIINRRVLNEMTSSVSPFVRAISYMTNSRFTNKIGGSRSNISAHYDLPNEVFSAFLSRDLTYSCAVFDEEAKYEVGDLLEERPITLPQASLDEPRIIPADDLERAQLAKLRMVADRARIKPGQRVLEIGCGWGSFAMMAARDYGAEVDTITISEEQLRDATRRIEYAGLSGSIRVHLMDYRNMPESFHNAFDAVVSIGVMEHVGIEFMTGWFESMSWAMKPEGSFKIFTMSTVPDTRWNQYATDGGLRSQVHLPRWSAVLHIGPHYARTLREWSYRFQRNFKSHIEPAMKEYYPGITQLELEIFKRKFIYYYAYSEAGFATRSISDHLFTLTREANLNL
ncbi:hypothetical protein M0805_009576 [Coniferiporia weirii]|nr:hypothetical protein M0805_009576 [Coniferiporia weirii]